MRVASVEKLIHKSDVYDIEVAKHHNFVLKNGCVVHNSSFHTIPPKDVWRCCIGFKEGTRYLLESMNYSDHSVYEIEYNGAPWNFRGTDEVHTLSGIKLVKDLVESDEFITEWMDQQVKNYINRYNPSIEEAINANT